MRENQSVTHIAAVDGLRFWMSWWVVIQHLLQASGLSNEHSHPIVKLLSMGGLAVMVFAIISGFVITHLVLTKREPYAPYVIRRFFRIYPLYLVAIVLALALRGGYEAVIVDAPWADPSSALRFDAQQPSLWLHTALHLLLLHGLVPDMVLYSASMSILGPAWSLSLEWQFYLVAPAIVAIVLMRGRPLIQLACFVGMAAAMSATYAIADQFEYPAALPLCIGFFLIGVVTRCWLGGTSLPRLLPALAVAGLNLGLYIAAYGYGRAWMGALPIAIWGVMVWYLHKIQTGQALNPLGRAVDLLLASRPAVIMGRWSYASYLLHLPLFVLVLWLGKAAGLPQNETIYFLMLVATCPVLVAASGLAYRWIEQPGIGLGKRLTRNLGARRIAGDALSPSHH